MKKNDKLSVILLLIGLALLIIFFSIMKPLNQVPSNAHICTEEEKMAEVCTLEYNPVCGSNGVTYGNGCQACASGIAYYVPGEC